MLDGGCGKEVSGFRCQVSGGTVRTSFIACNLLIAAFMGHDLGNTDAAKKSMPILLTLRGGVLYFGIAWNHLRFNKEFDRTFK